MIQHIHVYMYMGLIYRHSKNKCLEFGNSNNILNQLLLVLQGFVYLFGTRTPFPVNKLLLFVLN